MSSSENKLFYQIALTQIKNVGDVLGRKLLTAVGNAEQIFRSSRNELMKIENIASKTIDDILNPEVLRRAERELDFVRRNNIDTFFISDENYPQRLRDCEDAPLLLYYRGNADFNVKRVVSIVGTRNATAYGRKFCDDFVADLARLCPDTLIISGLAYGIDIQAHKAAVKHQLPTIGVLAHGLDRVYPDQHRYIAAEMENHGGLLTEFVSGTEPERYNFVRRNRIVAGMADATIVIESAEKSGSLITADLASSYCRDVFAVPGRIGDQQSAGCNKLIANHKADMILSAEHFVRQMAWDEASLKAKQAPRQQELFIELTSDEQKIADTLSKEQNGIHIDEIVLATSIPMHRLSSILFEMEMKGIIRNLPGNSFTLT